MLFGDATPDLMTAIVGVLGGGGVAGLVGWLLKVALPNVMEKFGQFMNSQIEAAKVDRQAAADERAALAAAHTEHISRLMSANADQMSKRDSAWEKVVASVGALAATVAELTAEVRAMRAIIGESHPEPVAIAPMPKPASTRNQKLPPGTIRGE